MGPFSFKENLESSVRHKLPSLSGQPLSTSQPCHKQRRSVQNSHAVNAHDMVNRDHLFHMMHTGTQGTGVVRQHT